jgi:heme-degrading monooxygenase HmoA
MIVRVFRVVVHDGMQETFRRFFLETALPLMRRQPGLISVTPGLPRDETPDEFCMVMVWRDLEALKAFAGEDWQHPHIHPDETGFVRKRYLHHYELATA